MFDAVYYTKLVDEAFTVEFDFSERLTDGQTVTEAEVAVVEKNTGDDAIEALLGETPTVTVDEDTSTIVSVPVIAGTEDTIDLDYVVTFTATLSDDSVIEGEVVVQVR